MKLDDLKPSTRETIRRIAKASGMDEKKVLSVMLNPSRRNGVSSHLDYGV